MTITAILGEIGSGKSLKLLEHAAELANNKRKRLVLNFAIDMKAFRKWASMKNYGWLCYLIDSNQVVMLQLSNYQELCEIFSRPSTVVCVDEAQIFFNSRNFKGTPLNVLADLCLSRHDGVDVVWCAQVDTHVDIQFRQLTQYFIYSRGMTKYDKELRNEKLIAKFYFYYTGSTYELWCSDLKARRRNISGTLKTWLQYASKVEFSPLRKVDYQLFKCYSSFNRLDKITRETTEKYIPLSIHEFIQVSMNGILPDGADAFGKNSLQFIEKKI
jgi:hypothetical protein